MPTTAPTAKSSGTLLQMPQPARLRAAAPALGASAFAHRVPNPPSTFIGRATQVAALKIRAKRHPVTVICGEGGIGKSALVRETLHRHFRRRVPQMIQISLHPNSGPHEVEIAALRALKGDVEPNWQRLMSDPLGLASLALDAAEESASWFVVDDLQHIPGADSDRLLGILARYALKSRWFFTSRRRPGAQFPIEQLLTVNPLCEQDISALVAELAPDSDDDARALAIHRAHGSPWRLRAHIGGAGQEILEGLSPAGLRVVQCLALVHASVPEHALCSASRCAPEDLATLVRAGLLACSHLPGLSDRRGDSEPAYHIHDLCRAIVHESMSEGVRAERGSDMVRVLRELGTGAHQTVDSLRILVANGAVGEAGHLLKRHGDELIAEGFAALAFEVLRDATDPSLADMRLRFAFESGAHLRDPIHVDVSALGPETKLVWAEALRQLGRGPEAFKVAEGVLASAHADSNEDLRASALALAATTRLNVDAHEALRILESAGDLGAGSSRLRVDNVRLLALNILDRGPEAVSLAMELRGRLSEVNAKLQAEVLHNVGWVCAEFGHLRQARDVLHDLRSQSAGANDISRKTTLLSAWVAIESGLLKEAKAELAKLRPLSDSDCVFEKAAEIGHAVVALATGDLSSLHRHLDRIVSLSAAGWPEGLYWERALSLRTRTVTAGDFERASTTIPETPTRASRAKQQAWQIGLDARWSGTTPVPSDLPDRPEFATLGELCESTLALTRGDVSGAIAFGRQALSRSVESGYGTLQAEALCCLCEAFACAGRSEELAGCARDLSTLAEQAGSDRFRAEAAFYRWTAGESDWRTLASLASAGHPLPAQRRSRRLLGAAAAADRVDDLVLMAVSSRKPTFTDFSVVVEGALPRFGDIWFVDVPNATILLPNAESVTLGGRKIVWGLLATLCRLGGTANTEQLAREVWDETAYHPLRHDNRTRTAVRELRKLIERDPASPERVITVDAGYRLAKLRVISSP